MSGARLCSLLRDLGYEDAESLEPDSLEWPFQYDDCRRLLEWICSSLRSSNVLSLSELSQYQQLLQEGNLLEGEDLDSAYDSISAFSSKQEDCLDDAKSLQSIRDSTLGCKAEAFELQKQVKQLQLQVDVLSAHYLTLVQGKRSRVVSASSVGGCIAEIRDNISAQNLRVNELLDKIVMATRELSHYHANDENGIYLAYSNFHEYLLEDSNCMKEMDQWFAKKLDSGKPLSWMSSGDALAYPQEDLEATRCLVLELQRLRTIFGISEQQWVEAQLLNAKQQAVLSCLKHQTISNYAHIYLDIYSLRKKQSELIKELSELRNREEKLLEIIPELCWLLAQLQDTYILEGEYDMKIMHQEFYICCQKEYISHLINLLARHQFMKIAYQLEKDNMQRACGLLKATDSELQGYLSLTRAREDNYLALVEAAHEIQEQGAVDDRDTLLHSIRDLLCLYANPRTGLSSYVSAPGIVQQICSLQSDLVALQSDTENTIPEGRKACIDEMQSLIQILQQLLFASSTTAQPILTPRPLIKELEMMEKINTELSAAIEELTLEHAKKNEIVKHHPQEVAMQRRVFVDFFCNPGRLRSQVQELIDRVRALQIA